jgi:hypothetical protein
VTILEKVIWRDRTAVSDTHGEALQSPGSARQQRLRPREPFRRRANERDKHGIDDKRHHRTCRGSALSVGERFR